MACELGDSCSLMSVKLLAFSACASECLYTVYGGSSLQRGIPNILMQPSFTCRFVPPGNGVTAGVEVAVGVAEAVLWGALGKFGFDTLYHSMLSLLVHTPPYLCCPRMQVPNIAFIASPQCCSPLPVNFRYTVTCMPLTVAESGYWLNLKGNLQTVLTVKGRASSLSMLTGCGPSVGMTCWQFNDPSEVGVGYMEKLSASRMELRRYSSPSTSGLDLH